MSKVTKEMVLDYHEEGKPGKIEIVPTKPYASQHDLCPCVFTGCGISLSGD